MISTDFAPNENWDDAWLSFKLLFQPWKWQKGKEIEEVKKNLFSQFKIFLFLAGRSALYFLLKSLNLPKNSEILIQGFTCEAVVLPILANNLKPIYVDIETKTLSMDISDLKNKLTKQAKVLILQHTFGMTPNNRKEIYALARQNGLFVIEDLAHGFNPKIRFDEQTTLLLSFGRTKSFSSVHGGAIVTSNKKLASKLKTIESNLKQPSFLFIFRTLVYKPLVMIIKSTYDIYLGKIIHKIARLLKILSSEITEKEKQGKYNIYFDRGYPNALASLLIHQLNKFEQKQSLRASISKYYFRKIKRVNFNSNKTCNRFSVLIKNRDQVVKKATSKNVFLGLWYNQVVAPKGLNLIKVMYKKGFCPRAEKICQQIINLPTEINCREAQKVIDLVYGN